MYREGVETYLLTRNFGLGYFGLEVFTGNVKVGDVFFNDYELEEVGLRENMAPYNIIKIMSEWVYY